MATDIFIVTYRRDAARLEFCLRSIRKHCRSFRRTVVVGPIVDEEVFVPMCNRYPATVYVPQPEYGDGHLWQNIIKTEADLYTDSDFVMHIDSDLTFTRGCTPLDVSTGGKPDLFYGRYGDAKSCAPWVPWKQVTENALGRTVEVETMRRFPILYPRGLYSATRSRIEAANEKRFRDFVRDAPKLGHAYHGYSEFNALGCTAYYNFPDQFKLRLFGDPEQDRPWLVRQFGGGQPISADERRTMEEIVS